LDKRRREEEEEADGGIQNQKTRTPHKDVGKKQNIQVGFDGKVKLMYHIPLTPPLGQEKNFVLEKEVNELRARGGQLSVRKETGENMWRIPPDTP
jgi:hypothetical protein